MSPAAAALALVLAQARPFDARPLPARPHITATRTATPPVIDGRLDDAVWATATVLDDLHQVNPTEYATASERTEVLLLYDKDALYVFEGDALWQKAIAQRRDGDAIGVVDGIRVLAPGMGSCKACASISTR